MARILVVYGTTEGQTAKVSAAIAEAARAEGHTVELLDVAAMPAGFRLEGFGGVVIGASVHMGRHNRAVVDFVKTHLEALGHARSAFFSVSLSAAGTREDDRPLARQYVDAFLEETSWSPSVTETVAGALTAGAQGPGGDGGASWDYEYTDRDAMARFAKRFVASVP